MSLGGTEIKRTQKRKGVSALDQEKVRKAARALEAVPRYVIIIIRVVVRSGGTRAGQMKGRKGELKTGLREPILTCVFTVNT